MSCPSGRQPRILGTFYIALLAVLLLSAVPALAGPVTLSLHTSQQGFTDLSKWDPLVRWGSVTLNVDSGSSTFDIHVDASSVQAVYGIQAFYLLGFSFGTDLNLTATTASISPDDSWTVLLGSAGGYLNGTSEWADSVWKPDRVRTVAPFDSLYVEISGLPLSATNDNFLVNSRLVEEAYHWDTPWSVVLGFENNNTPLGLPNTLRLYSGTYGPPDPPHSVPDTGSSLLLLSTALAGLAGCARWWRQ